MITDGWLTIDQLASIYINIVFCQMPFMQAAFVHRVQLAIGCVHTLFNFCNDASHKRERVSYVCVNKFKVLPHHQNFLATPLSDSIEALVRHSQAQKCLQINSKPCINLL